MIGIEPQFFPLFFVKNKITHPLIQQQNEFLIHQLDYLFTKRIDFPHFFVSQESLTKKLIQSIDIDLGDKLWLIS